MTGTKMKKEMSSKQRDELLAALEARFERNMGRHQCLVRAKLESRICGMEAKPERRVLRPRRPSVVTLK